MAELDPFVLRRVLWLGPTGELLARHGSGGTDAGKCRVTHLARDSAHTCTPTVERAIVNFVV